MPTDSAHDATPSIIPEHLRPFLISPAAYLEEHKCENVTHLVVGTVVVANSDPQGAQAGRKPFLPYSPYDASDEALCLPLASPLSASPSPPLLRLDHIFSPSPLPASSVSSSPPSSPEQLSPPPQKKAETGRTAMPTPAPTKEEHQSYSQPSPPSHDTSRQHQHASISRGGKQQQQQQQSPHRILLVQRSRHDYGGLCWEIPGGSCDPHDTSILSAAARELVEEAGLRVRRFVEMVDRQRHEWLYRGEIWRKLTFIVEAVEAGHGGGSASCAKKERGHGDDYEKDRERGRTPPLPLPRVRLDPEEHEDFVWASREDLAAGGAGAKTFAWIQDEQRQVILRAFDIIEDLDR